MHPLSSNQQSLSDALNATMITYNGNEMILQNDMGNTKIQDAKTGNIMGLRDGFIPVGLEEHGGIMYIASVNKEGVGEIGTIPSPVIKYNIEDDSKIEPISLDFSYKESPAVRISERVLYPEDKFLISIDQEAPFLKTISVSVQKANIKTESGYIGIKDLYMGMTELNYPYISKYNISLSDQLEFKRGLYKINLYSQTKNNTICLNNIVNNISILYKEDPEDNIYKYYQFACDNLESSNIDLDQMIINDANTEIDYFLHYPCIAPGNIAITTEPESIESFSLIENYTNEINKKGQIYPITLTGETGGQTQYLTAVQGFQYTTNSGVHIDQIEIQINNEQPELITNLTRYQLSDNSFLLTAPNRNHVIYREYLMKSKQYLKYLIKQPADDLDLNCYLYNYFLGNSLNTNLTLKVKYYCSEISKTVPLGTYTLQYNPYYFDKAESYIQEVYWKEHTQYDGNIYLHQYRNINSDEDVLDIDGWEEGVNLETYQICDTVKNDKINLGGNRDGNDWGTYIRSTLDRLDNNFNRLEISKKYPHIPQYNIKSSYLYLPCIAECSINPEKSNSEISGISLSFGIQSEMHHIDNSNNMSFRDEMWGLKSIPFNNREFVKTDTHPRLKFKVQATYNNDTYDLEQEGITDGYIYISEKSLVWLVKPEFIADQKILESKSWAYFANNGEINIKIDPNSALISTLQNDYSAMNDRFSPKITLKIYDIWTYNIDHFIPYQVKEQNIKLDVSLNLDISLEGYSISYKTNNKSSYKVYPQYDLWGIGTDGFTYKEVPVHYHLEKSNGKIIESKFEPSNLDTTNLIDLNGFLRKKPSNREQSSNGEQSTDKEWNSIKCNYIYPLSDRSITVQIPQTGAYFIGSGSGDSFTVQINGNDQKEEDNIFYLYKNDKVTVTATAVDSFKQIGIYRILEESPTSVIKQSCILFSENNSDYWKVNNTEQGTRDFKTDLYPAEGSQEKFLSTNKNKIAAPLLNYPNQYTYLTLRGVDENFNLLDLAVKTEFDAMNKITDIYIPKEISENLKMQGVL